jgi:hypothetical protein
MIMNIDPFIISIITIVFFYACSIEIDLYVNFSKNGWVKNIVEDERPLTSFVVNDVTWRRVYISSVIVCLLIVFFIEGGWTLNKFTVLLFITFTTLYIFNNFYLYHYFLLMYKKIEDKICYK